MSIFWKKIVAVIGKPDLDSVEGINAIPIPKYAKISGIQSPTENIEYILQRKATAHKKNGRMDLAIACLRKSNEIMPHSNFTWSVSDYLRLVSYLEKDGQIEEARRVEANLHQSLPHMFSTASDRIGAGNESRTKSLASRGYDLVKMTEHYPTCARCSMYQGRVFSVSGKDRRFPALSLAMPDGRKIHEGCKHIITPWVESMHTHEEVRAAIEFSGRPFIDSRAKEEVAIYEGQKQAEAQQRLDWDNYKKLSSDIPGLAPKSFSGYRRMKNMNSANYQKLVAAAKEKGIDL